nr:MAG TPA: hypothetical protein [Bacteriophage sp.]
MYRLCDFRPEFTHTIKEHQGIMKRDSPQKTNPVYIM